MYSLLFFGFLAISINSANCAALSTTKNEFSRAIGSPSMDTISVPFMSKPSFFPKVVDPKTMISKKTDFLGNLFGSSAAKGSDTSIPYSSFEFPSPSSAQMFATSSKLPKSDFSPESTILKRGIFGPFGSGPTSSPFFPGKPKFPFGGFGSFDPTSYGTEDFDSTSRRKRSLPEEEGKIPSEESEAKILETLVGPSMFGPVVDPSLFISKKTAFLDSLFKNLATTTTPTPDTATSTIVPPNFWIPSDVPMGPTAYSSKVSTFLDQLFDKIKSNISDSSEGIDKRSIGDAPSLAAAKDSITNLILDELTNLKNEMVGNFNDLIAFEKTATPAPSSAKKPFKPFITGMWPSKPMFDPMTGFKQKMAILSDVFDMLSELQKNISASFPIIEEKSTTPSPISSLPKDFPNVNLTLLEAIKSKLASIQDSASSPDFFFPKTKRTLSTKATNPIVVSPTEFENKSEVETGNEKEEIPRSVKMQMHQGYQNMPPGAAEPILSENGGLEREQDGDLFNRKNYWKNWADYIRQQNQVNEYHDHHHHRH